MLHAERLSPSRSLCIAQTNTRRPVHSFFRIPFHSTTTGQRMQEINELLSRQQYVFFTRSPVERNRVCVGSGLDRSAGTAFRILETSPLPSGTVRILPYASSVPLLSSANANTFVVPKGTYGGPEIGKKSLTDGGKGGRMSWKRKKAGCPPHLPLECSGG